MGKRNPGEFCVVEHPCWDRRDWIWLDFSKREPPGEESRFRIIRRTFHETRPINLRIGKPGLAPDVYPNAGLIAVFSRPLIEVLQQSDCTGLRVHPVFLYNQIDAKIIDRSLGWVRPETGCGPPDQTRGSSLIFSDHWKRDPTLSDAVGLYFDHSTWIGLDLFTFPHGNEILVTQRVGDAIRAAGLKGVRVVPVSEYGSEARNAKLELLRSRCKIT
jgi:hypothetical protein